MNNTHRPTTEVMALVEGQTEQKFIQFVLSPYLAQRGVYMYAALLRKQGENGGDVRFERAINDIGRHLKQRQDTWVTLMVDYSGLRRGWPGCEQAAQVSTPEERERIMQRETARATAKHFPELDTERRFLPYFSMHEIEALYFSATDILSTHLCVAQEIFDRILLECGAPEGINSHHETAPSQRLKKLSPRFKKTSTGITVAKAIGIDAMRAHCPVFNAWVSALESLAK